MAVQMKCILQCSHKKGDVKDIFMQGCSTEDTEVMSSIFFYGNSESLATTAATIYKPFKDFFQYFWTLKPF